MKEKVWNRKDDVIGEREDWLCSTAEGVENEYWKPWDEQ